MTMVLGADPEAEVKDWPEEPVNTSPYRWGRPEVRHLTDHFSYHTHMMMSQRNDATDKTILARYFGRMIDRGFTVASLESMIDRFYQSWGKEYNLPALAFVSRPMQERLLHEAEVVKGDPILTWMLNGMPNVGPFADSRDMRKAVLLAGDAILRYPDVVAAILKIEGTYAATMKRLETLDYLIESKLNKAPMTLKFGLIGVPLPPELQGPGPIRPKQDTIQLAIGAIPIKKDK